MTTAVATRLRVDSPTALVLAALGFAVWLAVAVQLWLGMVIPPYSHLVKIAVLQAAPLGVVVMAVLHPDPRPRSLVLLAGAMAVSAGAMAGTWVVSRQPSLVLALPAILASTLVGRRWPAASMVVAFALTGVYGSVMAFTPIAPRPLIDLLLAGLWIGCVLAVVMRRRGHAVLLSAAAIAVSGYLLVTAAAIPFAPNLDLGMRAFRSTGWYMLALLLITYGGWRRPTLEHVARGAVVVALAVGAYATLRWAIGPAAKETALAENPLGDYNRIASGEDKVQGSFPDGQALGFWMSVVIPFCVAAALTWRGVFRVVAIAAVPLCVIGLLGSGQRTGAIAATAGVALVLVLNQFARGMPGPRLGTALVGAVLLLVGVGAVFSAVVDNPEKTQRYSNILTPERDAPFQKRLYKWENAFADIEQHPFGRGLGTGGAAAGSQRFPGNASDEVDSSYVKIAYEQGFTVMVFFIGTLLLILVTLVRQAVWTRSTQRAALAIGAAGTMVALMVAFVGNLFVDRPPALAAWLIVGIGLAQFSTLEPDEPAAG